MKNYKIARIGDTFIDWMQISPLYIESLQWTDFVPITAQAKICYNDSALHVQLSAKEDSVLKRFTGPLDNVCRDSCLEFFFCPIWDDDRYINIECNPLGTLFVGFGHGTHDLVRIVPHDADRFLIETHPFEFEGGWGVYYSVPFDFIRLLMPEFKAESGVCMRANFYKCGDETVHPHYLAWNPISSDIPSFHRPQDFGCIVFE